MAAVSTAQSSSVAPKSTIPSSLPGSTPSPSGSGSTAGQNLFFAAELDEVQWDWTCSMPLPHVSFILNCMMPTWHPLVDVSGVVQAKRQQVRDQLIQTYADSSDMKVILTGSFEENLAVPTFFKRTWDAKPDQHPGADMLKGDIDMMVEAVGKHVGNSGKYERRIDTSCSDVRPGYLRVFYTTPEPDRDFCVQKDGKEYLSSSKITQNWIQSVKQRLACDGNVNNATVSINGPALTVQAPEMEDQDSVMCLLCPEWPKEASDWINRERSSGWPPKKVRDDIVASGCHIVPVAHRKSSWPEAEWRFSFARAEVRLCQSFSVTQRQCYMLFKTLIKYELMPLDLITSYCLKNLFLTSMERIPSEQWEDATNGLGAIFLCLLDELLYALINHDLPHYFMPKNNLIAHIPEDFVDDLMAKVSKMRRDPVKYLLNFDKIYMFPYSPIKSTFAEVFAPVLEHSKKYDNLLRNCWAAQIASCEKLLDIYLTELQVPGACQVSKQLCTLFAKVGIRRDSLGYIQHKILQRPPSHAAMLYELLLTSLPSVPASMLGNLACMYTSLYCTETDDTKKAGYCQKADSNFQKAISGQEMRAATAADYVVFLRKCNRAEEGIPLLLKILPQEKQDKSCNSYGMSERDSLDDNLKAEVDAKEGDIAAPSVILGFYQLAQCYFETGQNMKVQELMEDFAAACDNFPEESIVYSLLGYTYLGLEDYKAAHGAFDKVLDKTPNNTLATENKDLCEAMLMSLSGEQTSTTD